MLLVLMSAAGCLGGQDSSGDEPPVPTPHVLADFPGLGVDLARDLTVPATPEARTIVVSLTYTHPEFVCYVLDQPVEVTVAGMPAKLRDVGHFEMTRTPDGDIYRGAPPTFAVVIPNTLTGVVSVHVVDPSLDATFDARLH